MPRVVFSLFIMAIIVSLVIGTTVVTLESLYSSLAKIYDPLLTAIIFSASIFVILSLLLLVTWKQILSKNFFR